MATNKECACGCGEQTGSDWVPGHDSVYYGALCDTVGGLVGVKLIVEKHLGVPIDTGPRLLAKAETEKRRATS